MFNLEITSSAKEILKNKPLRTFLVRGALNFLEKYFGTEILLKIPLYLQNFDFKILGAVDTAYKLQALGIVKSIVKRKRKYPDEPFIYSCLTSSSGGVYGSGVDFLSEERTFWKSLAEAVERHLWFNSDYSFKNSIKAPYKDIKNRALNVFSLAGFSQKQKEEFSVLRFDENTIFEWVPAYSLILKKKIFCPLQLVSSLYFKQKVRVLDSRPQNNNDAKKEPMLRWCITTGLATGKYLEEAALKGLLEVVERDSFMVAYLNKMSPPIFDLEHLRVQDEEIFKIISDFERYNLEVYVIKLPSELPIHVISAFIIDRTGLGPALSVGASADLDFKTSFLDALSESLAVRYSLKGKFQQSINFKKIYREERLIYWSKTENLPKIDFFLKGDKTKFDLKRDPSNFLRTPSGDYYKNKLNQLAEKLKKRNFEVCFVELTTEEIKKTGLRCVQVVIPQLQPMHLNESIPYFGGNRLKEEYLLNKEPHPFP